MHTLDSPFVRASDSRPAKHLPSKSRHYDPVALARAIDVPTCNCDWVFDVSRLKRIYGVEITFEELRHLPFEHQFVFILQTLIPCKHVQLADDGFSTCFDLDNPTDEFKALLAVLLQAFPTGDDSVRLRALPCPEMATSQKARLGMYARRTRQQRELFHPGDKVKHDAVSIDADAGDGPLSRQSRAGVRRDRAATAVLLERYEGPLDQLARQAEERSAADRAARERQGKGECQCQNTPSR